MVFVNGDFEIIIKALPGVAVPLGKRIKKRNENRRWLQKMIIED